MIFLYIASTSTLSVVTNPTDNDGFPDNHIAVPVGNSQVLRCVGTGSSSPPSVVWVRNGEQVINGSRITITEGTPGGQQISSDLQISNFTLSDAGVYQCIFTEGAEVITTTPLRLDTGWCTLILHTHGCCCMLCNTIPRHIIIYIEAKVPITVCLVITSILSYAAFWKANFG